MNNTSVETQTTQNDVIFTNGWLDGPETIKKTLKILQFLSQTPHKGFEKREIAREIKTDLYGVSQIIELLETYGYLSIYQINDRTGDAIMKYRFPIVQSCLKLLKFIIHTRSDEIHTQTENLKVVPRTIRYYLESLRGLKLIDSHADLNDSRKNIYYRTEMGNLFAQIKLTLE